MQRIELICLDVEGTVFLFGDPDSTPEVQNSLWYALAHTLGPAAVKRDAELYESWRTGKISSYATWCRLAVENLVSHGLTEDLFTRAVERARLAPGAAAFIQAAKHRNMHIALISGGFGELVRHAQRQLAVVFGQGAVDILDWRDAPASLAIHPTYGAGKTCYAQALAHDLRIDMENVAMVGDGSSDLHLAQFVGRSFALHASSELRAVATDIVSSFDDIIGAL